MKSIGKTLFALLFPPLLLLTGCGSSGDSPVATSIVTGSVVAAPVSSATISVKDRAGDLVAGPVTSSATGTYTIAVPTSALSDDLRFEAIGGTFTDEATGNLGVSAGKLAAYIAGNTLSTNPAVHLDPASTIVHDLVVSGKSLSAAQTDFNNAFGFTPNPAIAPKNEAPAATPAENMAQRLAALRAAAFSQLTRDLNLTPAEQFLLITALSKDLEDGILDGKNAAGTVNLGSYPLGEDLQCRFSQALLAMRQNTTWNLTGLTIDQIGTIADSRIRLTPSYKVELIYPSGMTNAKMGKTSFTLRLSNRSDNSPVSGARLQLTPYMHMATKDHSSPVDAVVDNGEGTYGCTVYYLMTTMMSGVAQGVWELQVKINDSETAIFYPNVSMAMGTALVKLYGSNSDKVASLPPALPLPRTYLLFRESATSNTFNLFLASRDDAAMLSFPAVSENSTLHDDTGAPWTVDPATSSVQVSNDPQNFVVNAVDNGQGHWSASNPGLNLAAGATIYVKININGEVKTSAIAGTTDYATFTLP